jgi:hypothetical protein
MIMSLNPIAADHGQIRAIHIHHLLKELWRGELLPLSEK